MDKISVSVTRREKCNKLIIFHSYIKELDYGKKNVFAEEYFINAFKHGKKTFFGEKFDSCRKNVPGFSYEDEYDIVLLNGQSVGIIEVKYRVHDKDVANVIRKVKSFKINYPEYHHHRFYLGLASLVFADKVEDACIDKGIAVIKQVGDTVVINDGHLKVFNFPKGS